MRYSDLFWALILVITLSWPYLPPKFALYAHVPSPVDRVNSQSNYEQKAPSTQSSTTTSTISIHNTSPRQGADIPRVNHYTSGESAFRTLIAKSIENNRDIIENLAEQEGLTIAEVEELTQFAQLVQQATKWSEVEKISAHPITPERRHASQKLIKQLSSDFVQTMRYFVRNNSSLQQRWAAIRNVKIKFLEGYFSTTGMTMKHLDKLLASNAEKAQEHMEIGHELGTQLSQN